MSLAAAPPPTLLPSDGIERRTKPFDGWSAADFGSLLMANVAFEIVLLLCRRMVGNRVTNEALGLYLSRHKTHRVTHRGQNVTFSDKGCATVKKSTKPKEVISYTSFIERLAKFSYYCSS